MLTFALRRVPVLSFEAHSLAPRGRKIVLAASTSESCEHMHSTWKQMLLATLPARYASVFNVDWAAEGEVWADGQPNTCRRGCASSKRY
jgi:hypothetical protein